MKLLIASNNANKVREIRQILGGSFAEIVTLREAGLEIDVLEDGQSFAENALKKAETVQKISGFDAVLADDSGLCVDALNGAPGVYSARYAGEGHDERLNNQKLMDDMRGIPENRRGCRFVSAAALARRGRPSLCAEGAVEGRLLFSARGGNGFGYDPYFYYEPLGKSFAEMTAEEKNAVSHRRRALENLKRLLDNEA
ncbi:MAG: RdgB/HAM1 family non-canonical purine NTP pyrophosphatase [Clostridia bacterium]|nr:RdgB/HAM1 family non-canonical purine NTP pyrophosphatase [Clostridia bacterium]